MKTSVTPVVSTDELRHFRENGFAHFPAVLDSTEVERFRDAAVELTRQRCIERKEMDAADRSAFFFEAAPAGNALRELLAHPRVLSLAEQLAGKPMRLWDGGVLIKDDGSPSTVVHDDQCNYPFTDSPDALSVWIALVDVPVERGCMVYVPGSHLRPEPDDPVGARPPGGWVGEDNVYRQWPELRWEPQIAMPINAGDLNFHHSREVHYATANTTDRVRVCFGITFVNADTTYRPTPESDPLDLETGAPLPDTTFPLLSDINPGDFVHAARPNTA